MGISQDILLHYLVACRCSIIVRMLSSPIHGVARYKRIRYQYFIQVESPKYIADPNIDYRPLEFCEALLFILAKFN